jgi:hypothetical protein
MTRLESGAVTIKAEPQSLDGVVGTRCSAWTRCCAIESCT